VRKREKDKLCATHIIASQCISVTVIATATVIDPAKHYFDLVSIEDAVSSVMRCAVTMICCASLRCAVLSYRGGGRASTVTNSSSSDT
jgi:hypothetical protein